MPLLCQQCALQSEPPAPATVEADRRTQDGPLQDYRPEMEEPSPQTKITDTGRRCGKCGYKLTGSREPPLCPECGTPTFHDLDPLQEQETTLAGKLTALNVVAVLLAVGALSARPAFFGPTSGLSICFIIPLQAVVGIWAFFAYVARPYTQATNRWMPFGAILPTLLGVLSFVLLRITR